MEFVRLPFGLVNEYSACAQLMRVVLRGLENVTFYFDNIYVYCKTFEAHSVALEQVLARHFFSILSTVNLQSIVLFIFIILNLSRLANSTFFLYPASAYFIAKYVSVFRRVKYNLYFFCAIVDFYSPCYDYLLMDFSIQ